MVGLCLGRLFVDLLLFALRLFVWLDGRLVVKFVWFGIWCCAGFLLDFAKIWCFLVCFWWFFALFEACFWIFGGFCVFGGFYCCLFYI